MASIINATTTGLTVTPDNSGQLTLSANGVTALTANTAGHCTFTNNFASVAGYPAYQCRAWVNFNGTGTVAIRASGNVTSITDNGEGDYTINFTTAMPDANYAVAGAARFEGSASATAIRYLGIINANGATLSLDMSATFVRINVGYANGATQDPSVATVIIVR